MTVTLSPEQLAEGNDVENETDVVKSTQERANRQELAALLAQAYVAMSLFA